MNNEIPKVEEDRFAVPPSTRENEYTDGRARWDWHSKYPSEATRQIRFEAIVLIFALLILLMLAGFCLGLANYSLSIPIDWLGASPEAAANNPAADASSPILLIDFKLLAVFFTGIVGGVTFSIKWLVHSVAKGLWHCDRRYWRLLIPFLGGVYACVVLTLFDAGFLRNLNPPTEPKPVAIIAAFAFLVGYFSDGVSGLLSNVANAVFGTLKK